MNCRTDSKTHEPFQDLSLDIPDRFHRRTKDQEETCCLTYSLARFFKVEELADSELYFCDNCMGKQRSTKRFWVHRLPNVSKFDRRFDFQIPNPSFCLKYRRISQNFLLTNL